MKRLDASGILDASDGWIAIQSARSGAILGYYHPMRHELRVVTRNGRIYVAILPIDLADDTPVITRVEAYEPRHAPA